MEKKLMNVEELAQAIGVKPETVYAWTQRGKIPVDAIRRPGGRILRFDQDAIRKWIDAGAA